MKRIKIRFTIVAFCLIMCICSMIILENDVFVFATAEITNRTEQLVQNEEITEEQNSSNDTNTVSFLENQLEEYITMKEAATEEKSLSQIESLISKTEALISACNQEMRQSNLLSSSVTTYSVGGAAGAIAGLVSAFIQANYKLAAELLTYAYGEVDTSTSYIPQYGGRVISSSATAEIANGNKTSGSSIYGLDMSQSRNSQDLFFAINKFDYTKPNSYSKKVIITDRYDFDLMGIDFSSISNPLDFLKEALIALINDTALLTQVLGLLTPYDIKIEVDTAEPLGLNIISKSDGVYKVRGTNQTDSDLNVFYNKKMCFEADAREWSGLKDVETINLSAGDSQTVEIEENLFATDIVFSYIKDKFRVVTFAADVKAGNSLSAGLSSELSKIKYDYIYLLLDNMGKSGGSWNIKITNILDYTVKVYYNTKMCNKGDAQNWTGLKDVDSFDLSSGASIKKSIKTNVFATSITVSYIAADETRVITYANNLSSDGGIKVMYNYI